MNKTDKGFCISAIGMFACLLIGNRVLICIVGIVFCYYAYKIMSECL